LISFEELIQANPKQNCYFSYWDHELFNRKADEFGKQSF